MAGCLHNTVPVVGCVCGSTLCFCCALYSVLAAVLVGTLYYQHMIQSPQLIDTVLVLSRQRKLALLYL